MTPKTRRQEPSPQEKMPQEQLPLTFPSNEDLKTQIAGLYLRTPQIQDQVTWAWNPDFNGHILTSKTTNTPTTLHGIFMIAEHPFQLVPDGSVPQPKVNNPNEKTMDTDATMKASYALNPHKIVLTNNEITPQHKGSSHDHANTSTHNTQTDNPLLPEFSLPNWPMSELNKSLIDNLVQSGKWDMNPLPLFTEDSDDIVPPWDYNTLLPGLIAQITFILKYTQVKTPNGFKTTFTMIMQEIIVLKKPLPSHTAPPQMLSKKQSLP
ncbi:hypothetical protein BS47DRAFT_1368766 [Hydnum rufescens UP504]|uniref:Uncharacterized protein n=1 Tax=Hydnum rufescens UP504 TaxID=1448309 RepID=A0A9P6AFX7_9AGAM|nr:hypothetical protein BS47DRAFT_1368766 [Hydnum rufescens UP504]